MEENERLDTQQRIELSEGVMVDLRVAGLFPRVMAYLIDWFIRVALIIGLSILFAFLEGFGMKNVGQGLILLTLFLVISIYPILFEAGKKGATPGKRSLGLRVVQPSGAPITFGQALVRNLLRFADMMPFFTYGIGIVTMLFTKRFQRLGDLAANTMVVYAVPYQQMGMKLEAESAGSRILPRIPLTRADEAAIVSFAERAPYWSDDRRAELADLLQSLTGERSEKAAVVLKQMGNGLQGRL